LLHNQLNHKVGLILKCWAEAKNFDRAGEGGEKGIPKKFEFEPLVLVKMLQNTEPHCILIMRCRFVRKRKKSDV